MKTYLDFETKIAELEGKIAELKSLAEEGEEGVSIEAEVAQLEEKANKALADLYRKLDAWQKTQVARHPDRPHCIDYIDALIEDFTPLAGDRKFAEDLAIIGGPGRFRGRPVMVIGQEKGHDIESRKARNFGMARPEGYRKAVRLMDMAERFSLPVITLGVPMVSLIIGEGGSGGAIAIATANKVLMLEHSIYSVISPEGAASILWRDPAKAQEAARALKLTAQDLLELGVIDEIIPEAVGGAHRAREKTIHDAAEAIERALLPLVHMSPEEVRRHRREKYLAIGRDL